MRRTSALVAVFVLLVVSSGCLGFGEPPDRSERAEQTLADVQAAIDDVETYQYETNVRLSATAEGETEEREVQLSGHVDVTQRLSANRIRTEDENLSSYITNDTVYQACRSPWGWGNKSAEIDGDWVSVTPLGRQLQFFESGDLELETEEPLPEDDAVLLVGHPSPEALEEYGISGTGAVFGGPSVESITVSMVIDNETHRPLRWTLAFEIAGGGGSGQGSVDTYFSEYNEPVSITIPDEVREEAWETGCPGS